MFDEVYRLQEFLGRLSRVHAVVGRWFDAPARSVAPARDARFMQQSSLASWRAMRAVAGLLHAHPNARFHPADLRRRHLGLRVYAAAIDLLLFSRSLRFQWLFGQLDDLGRMAADIRAVSLSLSLSTAFERIQIDLRELLRHAEPRRQPQFSPAHDGG
jgi:hypothetical protein